MDTNILLEAICECVKRHSYFGGAYIIKQFLRDIETYNMDTDDVRDALISPEDFAPHIILAYESLLISKEPEAVKDYKCLYHQINHVESFSFGDPRYHGSIGIECPGRLVMRFMEIVREEYFSKTYREWKEKDEWDRACERKECEKYFEDLKIFLDAPAHTIWMTYMTFVSSVWRDGFYDFICEKLKYTDFISVPLGKTLITIIDSYRCGVIFSANSKRIMRCDIQTSGVMFLKGELEDPSGHRGNLHTCYVDLPTALSLIYEAIRAWPAFKKSNGL